MIRIRSTGDFNKTRDYLNRNLKNDVSANLNRYGQLGLDALSKATPVDSGLTAGSWRYRIVKNQRRPGIEWYNTNVVSGTPVAILIQYGHGTGTGGYVQGRDYINPAMRPVFDKIVSSFLKEVT